MSAIDRINAKAAAAHEALDAAPEFGRRAAQFERHSECKAAQYPIDVIDRFHRNTGRHAGHAD